MNAFKVDSNLKSWTQHGFKKGDMCYLSITNAGGDRGPLNPNFTMSESVIVLDPNPSDANGYVKVVKLNGAILNVVWTRLSPLEKG
jgi:hypothetical protein